MKIRSAPSLIPSLGSGLIMFILCIAFGLFPIWAFVLFVLGTIASAILFKWIMSYGSNSGG
jgi:hypothetical protein